MLTQELINSIDLIDNNLKNYFSNISQTDLEIILSRMAKLTEEVWELNSDVLQKFYKRRNWEFNEENLKLEFADVIITTLLLAKSLNIDVNETLKVKIDKIRIRGGV